MPYIPRRDAEFDVFFLNVCDYVTQKCAGANPAWTHIPADAVAALVSGRAEWENAYAAVREPHLPAQTREKNRVRRRQERALRLFIQRYIYVDDPVTNLDRDNMTVRNRKSVRSIHEDTPEHVEMSHRPYADCEILFEFRVAGTGSRGIPRDYKGVAVYFRPLAEDEEPPDRCALATCKLVTRAYWIERFDSALKGRRVAVTAAWENSRGIEGTRCEVQVVVVP